MRRLALGLSWPFRVARWAATLANNPPTFTKDVAPILQEKCQNCHRNWIHGADVAGYLRRNPAVGKVDQSSAS